ncbi:nucleoside/nucleotide kinase family protein [Litoreibacter roseus]|uniref:Nucleoside triphosphate hydrolase n=1 Tax=Litoreibacter roseus TaxID=2601869 RepID=A0A6N6JDT7_9RHOB|nr:nucleoside/nucleotide kinase family protein [Litoreibacter roseus]GFE64304.1 nucleoside triphosphate hydrolase [Litoreibacter roseus]
MSKKITVDGLVEKIATLAGTGRKLIAVAGPPASGKSTLAEDLVSRLTDGGCAAALVPMDGFHLDNRVLEPLGLLLRKGAPDSFDAAGFLHLVKRLQNDSEVVYPVFDRPSDCAIAGAAVLKAEVDIVVIEGNYLLFDAPVWRDLKTIWDVSVWLDIPEDVLRDRLIQRWLDHGMTPHEANTRAEGNDLRNARQIAEKKLSADYVIDG